jgi:putative transposase
MGRPAEGSTDGVDEKEREGERGDGKERAVTGRGCLLGELSPEQRRLAHERFLLLRPCLEEGVSLAEMARTQGIPLGNVQRWVQRYRCEGLVGLARRGRSDRGKRRGIPQECVQLIEGLALQRPKRAAAEIHRQVSAVALQRGWADVSYGRVYDIMRRIDPELVVLAHEGSRIYQEEFDVLFLQEVSRPNERWQADHCWLNIWLVNDKGKPARPYLTIILDEYSRAVMGYRLSFDAPSAYQTALTLRQAMWGKNDAQWSACGIPETFYTDHGSDFTSKHMEQVAGHLSMRLVFSQPGRPRGRGKIERFFRTVRARVLPGLAGYIPRVKQAYRSARKRQRQNVGSAERMRRQASLTLDQFERMFRTWLLGTYHQQRQRKIKSAPMARWQQGTWLPRVPESLEHLDLLLLRETTLRQVHQEGIFFHGHRYMDTALAGCVHDTVAVYYDPLNLATISVYIKDGSTQERFLCQARCQDFGGQTVSVKALVAARNAQRKELHGRLDERKRIVEQAHTATQLPNGEPVDQQPAGQKPTRSDSRFLPPPFMAQISSEFVPEEDVLV